MTDSRPPKPKRRWYQFRLRTLLLVTLVLGVVSGWIGSRLQKARRNRQAIAEVQRSIAEMGGGDVHVTCERGWLEYLFCDPGEDVVIVHARGLSQFDDGALEQLLTELEHVNGLTNLKGLELSGTKVTDAGLVHLKGLTNLEWANLRDTKVTDAGLEHLKGLTNLTHLFLWGTKVTLEGVDKLQEALPNCRVCYFPHRP